MKNCNEIDNTRFSIVTPKGVRLTDEGERVFSTTYIAKQYGVPRDKFFGMLLLADVAYYRFRRHLPKRHLIEQGYFVLDKLSLKHSKDGSEFKVTRGWWTIRGSRYLAGVLRRRFSIVPKNKWYDDEA